MDFDNEIIKKIKSMNQDELSAKISELSRIIGANEKFVRRMVGTPEQLQRKIGEMSEDDIRRLASRLKPAHLDMLKNTLDKRDGNGK